MKVFRRLPPPAQRQPCALTIGNFDGVHLGHRAVLQRLVAVARERSLPACVLTFEPHPREYFARVRSAPPGEAPSRILTERIGVSGDVQLVLGLGRVLAEARA